MKKQVVCETRVRFTYTQAKSGNGQKERCAWAYTIR